ncbi:tobamovirus multiplication 2A [Olea europaea subsp. europaea]|uniref:Tobamovirus multiplication 2A n=1 Tax=Olea europaea subsp. europaea TaxID=158383 RepID=A0A8S0SWH4_OLEEU|nr:tobamovirus multiplication 2A [Olea europaea subsp. europaea]
MACRGFWQCLLKLLNFLLILVGLAMVGYGIYLFVEYKNAASSGDDVPVSPPGAELAQLGRPLLMAVYLADSIFDKLPKAWFIYSFIGIGVILFIISCCGCIGTAARNGCCLTCYAVLLILLILIELGLAAFMFFDKNWRAVILTTSVIFIPSVWKFLVNLITFKYALQEIPTDKTGNFDMMYAFLENHWKIIKWVALGVVVLEALIFLLALIVRAANRPTDYDSDDEYISGPRQQIRQPLINNRPTVTATGVPVTGTLDHLPSRSDAWSTRMREKYGLDTSEFTHNPSESNRYQQAALQPSEERSRCTIM